MMDFDSAALGVILQVVVSHIDIFPAFGRGSFVSHLDRRLIVHE